MIKPKDNKGKTMRHKQQNNSFFFQASQAIHFCDSNECIVAKFVVFRTGFNATHSNSNAVIKIL